MYIIELDRWNIKAGIPSKPYTNEHYLKADTNIQGLNSAIQFAAANGFSKVVLPKGEYALCYPRVIKMESNITFDLNGSTLKVIYDSDQKSPFDSRTTTDYYNFKGNSFVFENTTNSHLIGGTIIGCRADRSFINSKEATIEHTYGVVFSKGTNHSSIKHCFVRDYMGDNITFSSDSIGGLEINQGLSLNKLNYNTGQLEISTNTVITTFIDLPKNLPIYKSFIITGVGYSRLTKLNSKDFSIFFYDKNNNFIGVMQKRKIYTDISIPVSAAKFRLQFYNETNPSKNLQITLRWGNIPHHNIVENNEIFNGHRGGITLGGSYNVIQHNVIKDNGKGSVSFLDGKPVFPNTTRYSINQEDSYGDNCIIQNNLIYGSTHGILAGCYSIQIENNHIYNIDSTAIKLYSLLFANVRGNFIYNCSDNIGLMTSNFENAYINISENSMHGGNMSLIYNNSYQVNITNNDFVDVSYINMGTSNMNYVFSKNRIKYSEINSTPTIIAKTVDDCILDSLTVRDLALQVDNLNGCSFKNLKINISGSNQFSNNEKIAISNCEFTNCLLINRTFIIKNREVIVNRSAFSDTVVKIININSPNSLLTTVLEDCSLTAKTITHLFATDSNQPSGLIKMKRCIVEISNPNFSYLIQHDKAVRGVFTLFLKDSNFIFHGSSLLNFKYYNDVGPIIKLISANNQFTNINLPVESSGFFIEYDIENTYKSKVVLQLQGDEYSAIVTHNLETLDPYVLCLNDALEVLYPKLILFDKNTIVLKYKENVPINVTVKKLL